MLEKLKQTVKHTGFFALGNISPKLSGFILLPIYTKLISVADYGILGLFEVVELLSVHILSFGIPQALLRWHGLTESEIKKKNYIFTLFIFLTCICVGSFLIILSSRSFLAEFLFGQNIFANYFVVLFISISFTVLSKLPLTLLRSEEKSHLYATFISIQFAFNLIANIYFVAILKYGVKGILISQAISTGLIFLILTPYLFKRMNPHLELAELKKMILFSYPFIFSAIASTILNVGDRYLLTKLSTLEQVGLYSLGYKFSNIMKMLLVDSFMLGLPVIGWKIVKENSQPKRFFSKVLTYMVFGLLWFGLILSAYCKGMIHRFASNPNYWDAYHVVPFFVLSIIFVGMQSLFFFELQIPQKTKLIPRIVGCAAVLNIILNILLIPKYGMMGAVYATVFAQFIALFVAYRVVQKVYPVKYEINRILILFGIAIGLFFITAVFNNYSLIERIIYKGLVILSFPFILYLIRFYEPIELDRIRGSIKKWSGKILLRKPPKMD